MRDVFLGKPVHWAMLVVVAVICYLLGEYHVHISNFNPFIFAIFGVSAAAVIMVVAMHTPGDRDTRESLHEDDG